MAKKKPQTLSVTMPEVNAKGIAAATALATFPIAFDRPEGITLKPVKDVSENDLRDEAVRIAAIADSSEREAAVFACLDSSLQVARDAQETALSLLFVARGIQTAETELLAVLRAMQKLQEENRRLRSSGRF